MEANIIELLGGGAVVLLGSLALGLFALWLEKCRHEDTTSADLFYTGNRQLNTPPMTFSLIATIVNPLYWLSLPSVIAYQGLAPAIAGIIGLVLATPVVVFLFLPVFFHVQPVTAFEYLEQRFNRLVKMLASGLFVCYTLTALPAMLYVPVAVLQKETGVHFLYAGPIVLVVAVAYTAMGGMRAVQWASILHILLAVATLCSIIILGVSGDIWTDLTQAKVLDLSRGGWWYGFGTAFWVSAQLACGQPQVQRYLSVPLLEQSKLAVVLTVLGVGLVVIMQAVTGVLMAAQDPGPRNMLVTNEHLLNYYVEFTAFSLKTIENVPGLTALFVAALCSLVLSTLASGVHALAAVLTMDVQRGKGKRNWHELPVSRGRLLMALASVLVFLASALMVVIPEPLLSVALTFPRITSGALLGLFCLGMLVPWANSVGALTGAGFSLAIVWAISHGESVVRMVMHGDTSNEAQSLTPIGFAITFVLGSLVSAIACPRDISVLDPNLVSPVVRWLYRKFMGVPIGINYEDSSSVEDDFRYEAVPVTNTNTDRRAGSPYARGGARLHAMRQREQQQQEDWPDITYPHLSRRRDQQRLPTRPLSGLAWDSTARELYLEPIPTNQ